MMTESAEKYAGGREKNYKMAACGLFFSAFLERATGLVGPGRVNRGIALLDVADDALLVDDEGGPAAHKALLVEDAVSFDGLALHVAQEREGHIDVLLEP